MQPTRASRWTRIVYFLALFGLAVYVLVYTVLNFFFINNRGLVEVDRVEVASVRGGRILELPVQSGDHVKRGDLLVRLKSPENCEVLVNTGAGKSTAELRSMRLKQLADRAQLKALQRIMKDSKSRLKDIDMRHAMELSLGSSGNAGRQSLESDLFKTSGEINSLKQMIAQRSRQINELVALLNQGVVDTGCEDELIRAPYAGTIVSKVHKKFEVMQRTQTIMDLMSDDADVYIESYLNNSSFNMINQGNELTVYFPDNQTSQARIRAVESTSLPFTKREFSNYLPHRTRIRMTLEPADKADIPLWKQFNQMEVEVHGWR